MVVPLKFVLTFPQYFYYRQQSCIYEIAIDSFTIGTTLGHLWPFLWSFFFVKVGTTVPAIREWRSNEGYIVTLIRCRRSVSWCYPAKWKQIFHLTHSIVTLSFPLFFLRNSNKMLSFFLTIDTKILTCSCVTMEHQRRRVVGCIGANVPNSRFLKKEQKLLGRWKTLLPTIVTSTKSNIIFCFATETVILI